MKHNCQLTSSVRFFRLGSRTIICAHYFADTSNWYIFVCEQANAMTSFKIISLLFIPSKNPMSSKISQKYSKDQTMLMTPTPQTCISKLILNLINGSKSGHEIKSPRSLFFILTGNLTDCHHVYKSVFQSFAFSFTWIHLRQETRLTNITDTHIIVTPKKKNEWPYYLY